MRILLFGDIHGIPQLIRHIPLKNVCGLVAASIRPQYHDDLKKFAIKNNLPLLIQPRFGADGYSNFRKNIEDLAPDLIWVYSYSMILRDDILSAPKFGGINIHGGLLPEYRGCSPTEWSIIKCENIAGVTLHVISSGIDEGPIIDRSITQLFIEDTWQSASDRIALLTDQLIERNLKSILLGNWSSTPQVDEKAQYHRRRYPEDGRFEWDSPVIEIYNLVRALVAPHPGASYLRGDGSLNVIDCYKTPAEITLMKFDNYGNEFLSGNRVYLEPIENFNVLSQDESIKASKKLASKIFDNLDDSLGASMLKSIDSIHFLIRDKITLKAIGYCKILNIDWEVDTCENLITLNESKTFYFDIEKEVRKLLIQFAKEELKLKAIF
jgi:methionyl-tRNA formyltransferase